MESTTEQIANADRPRSVTMAVQFLIASLAIGLITSIFHLAQRISGAPLLFGSLIVIVFFGLGFLLINRISARRNWARIIWLVLILFGLPFAFKANLEEVRRNVLLGTPSVIVTILQLIGTFLLFTKQSNLWFRTRK